MGWSWKRIYQFGMMILISQQNISNISEQMKHAHLFRQELQTQKCDISSNTEQQVSNAVINAGIAAISSDKIQIEKAFQFQKEQTFKFNAQKIKLFYKQDYQPAKFSRSLQYKYLHSYLKKNSDGDYQAIKMMDNAEQFKYFGLGIYFYIEFMRRINWLFFFMSVLVGFTIVINWYGQEMSDYSSSFSTYLIKSTLGNYNKNKITTIDGYLVTIVPAANFLALFIFYMVWKAHFFQSRKKEEESSSSVRPQKYTIQISGLHENFKNQSELKKFFSSFGQVYEVSLVSRYNNKLSYFSALEQLEEDIKQEQLQMILGGGNQQQVQKLKSKKAELVAKINSFDMPIETISAFIHFQMEKSRNQCLTQFNNNYLFDNCSNNCMRNCCSCCTQSLSEKFMFYNEVILIKNDKVPPPQDINWNSYQIGLCQRLFRFLLSFIIILIFLAISTTIIGMCSIYITSHASDCENVTVPSTLILAKAQTDANILRCFCEINLVSTIRDSELNLFCGTYLADIYISQGIQYAIIFCTAVINFLFSLLVSSLVNFVRPASKSSKLFSETLIYTVFIIMNSIFVPLLVYANIYGFSASNYVSFLTIISSDIKNFLAVDNIKFHTDFNTIWYKNVSVVFINFIIIDTIIVWILFAVDKYLSSHSSLEGEEGKILQKHMNKKIISYKLNVYKEMAGFYLILVMCMLFCTGMPIIIPLTCINMFSRYLKNRTLIQNNSSQIEGIGQDFNALSIAVIPLILILCPLVGQWMLVANEDIYPDGLSLTLPILNGYFTQLDKQLYLPFYILISLLTFCEFFVYNIFVRFVSCLCGLCYQERDLSLSYNTRPFSEYAKGMNVLSSYNIRNNAEMKNIILTLEKYLIDKEINGKS